MRIFTADGNRLLRTGASWNIFSAPPNPSLLRSLSTLCSGIEPPVLQVKSETGESRAFVKLLRPESQREVEVFKVILENSVIPAHHLPKLMYYTEELLFLKSVPGLQNGVRTLKDLTSAKSLPRLRLDALSSVLAQVVALISLAQQRDPKFAHNDAKLDNFLVTYQEPHSSIMIGNKSIQSFGARVVWIDLETVTGDLPYPPLKGFDHIPDAALESFGISPSMPFCSLTDLHLVLLELWHDVRSCSPMPDWMPVLRDALARWMPLQLLSTFSEGNKLVSKMNRLSTRGRQTLNLLIASGEALDPEHILADPFFTTVCSSMLPEGADLLTFPADKPSLQGEEDEPKLVEDPK